MSAPARPNTIAIQGRDYILVSVGATAAHLVARADPGHPARPIVDHPDAVLNPAYDPDELIDTSWSRRTLAARRTGSCARPRSAGLMKRCGTAGRKPWAPPVAEGVSASSTKQFPTPLPDDRLAWNVIRCVEELEQWGSIHIRGVPADQAELLRKAVRSEARKRGWVFVSSLGDGQLIVSCENALSPERRKFVMADSMQRMHTINSGLQLPQPSWRLDWS